MSREFVNPNLHVIIIHYPLGLLSLGALIELLGMFFWRRSILRVVGRWMILIGAMAMVPASTLGLYAMADVNRTADNFDRDDMTWAEVREESPVKGEAWEMMTLHGWLNAAGTVVMMLLVVLWLGSSDLWRDRLHVVYVLLLLGTLGVILAGAWYGGEMVYRHGVGVEGKHATEVESADDPPEKPELNDRIAYFAPPLQVHVILAGSAIALALVALGVSLRNETNASLAPNGSGRPASRYDDGIAAALAPQPQPRAAYPGQPQFQTVEDEIGPRRAPMARFWLLAALLAIATALTGWWTLAQFSGLWSPREMWELVFDKENPRRLAHTLVGGGMIVLLLILAIASRFPVGRRLLVSIFALILLAAVVAQIWFGSLLMFDSTSGPLSKFNGAAASFLPQSESESESEPATEPAEEPASKPATSAPATAPAS